MSTAIFQKEYTLLSAIEKNLLEGVPEKYVRDIASRINWEDNSICLYGERGVGKTTLFLQQRKYTQNAFYFSADSHRMESIGLFDFVFWVWKNHDVTTFFIDEIHRYSNWVLELKNCIDAFPNIAFRVSGSSSMMLYSGSIDLGRRITDYKIFPLSFREFLAFKHDVSLPVLTFSEITKKLPKIVAEYSQEFSAIQFLEYQKQGMYPYGVGRPWAEFMQKNNKLLEKAIQEDMFGLFNMTQNTTSQLKKVFFFLASMSPSEISVAHLAKKIGTNKELLGNVLEVLDNIGVVHTVEKNGNISEVIRKQKKIFLGNPNLYATHYATENIGTIRESFFLSQVKMAGIQPFYITDGDYSFEEKGKTFFVEIGGKKKSAQQLQKKKNSFVLVDDIYGDENKIPLWTLGFLA